MKKQDIFHIVIGFIFIFNSMTDALARDYRVVEIDSVEYYEAKCGFEKETQYLGKGSGCNCKSWNDDDDYFLYSIVENDEEARDIYIEEILGGGMWHDFSPVNLDTFNIKFLQFGSPRNRFVYAATIKYLTDKHVAEISISDVKINSAPIAISKDGYVAGFKQSNDAYFADFKIYKITEDERGKLDITELFAYSNIGIEDDSWRVSNDPFSVFWKSDVLYIEGLTLQPSAYVEVPCYFKVIPHN